MTIRQLMELQGSVEAPYNHKDYTVWLHNKILEKVTYELWEFREQKTENIKSSYAALTHVMSLPSLKTIKTRD